MKHTFTTVLFTLLLTGCATSNTLLDGLLGRYHNYDPVEYAQTVHLVLQARELEAACADRNVLQYQLNHMDRAVDQLRVYAEGRRYNARLTELANTLDSMIADTANKETMSAFFCQQRSKNIVKATETIRTLSGEKPE